MYVIGAGLPRTGTLTQKLAVEMLGLGPCYHWVDVLADLDRGVEQWNRALDGDARWGEIFDGFHSSMDWPGGFFYRELAEAYPEAKVVLSVRDPHKWQKSFRDTIWEMGHGDSLMPLVSNARAQIDPSWARYLHLVDRMFWTDNGTFAGAHADASQMIAAMERHHAAVRRDITPERLLEWDVTEGWEPLCRFLGVDVPDEPLPHANDRETFIDRVVGGAIDALARWHAVDAPAPA